MGPLLGAFILKDLKYGSKLNIKLTNLLIPDCLSSIFQADIEKVERRMHQSNQMTQNHIIL